MKLGLLTACLPGWSLERIARWASGHGYEAPGVAAWPSAGAGSPGPATGVLSVEHEDPLWGGTDEKVFVGLEVAYRTLRPLVVARECHGWTAVARARRSALRQKEKGRV